MTADERPERELIGVLLNYLRWIAAEDENAALLGLRFNADTALDWFCPTIQHRPLLDGLKSRYASLAGLDAQLAAFPKEKALVEKVLIPLHQAKVAFVLGHELGCIALCGMVAEMLATLRFQVSTRGSGPNALPEKDQERLFGRSFERVDHSRRLGILEMLNLIDSTTGGLFTDMARIRNKYLHRLSEPHENLEKEARRSYELAVTLAVKILGLEITQDGVKIDPEILAYIKARRPASPPPENPPAPPSA